MKYLGAGSMPDSRFLKLILCFTLFYFILLGVTDVLIYIETTGFSPKAVAEHYLGSEDGFREPATYRGLLEQSHFHLFSMAMALLLVSHLAAFTGLPRLVKKTAIIAAFISGLAEQASGWLIRYAGAELAILKVVSFAVFAASFFALSVITFACLCLSLIKSRPAKG